MLNHTETETETETETNFRNEWTELKYFGSVRLRFKFLEPIGFGSELNEP